MVDMATTICGWCDHAAHMTLQSVQYGDRGLGERYTHDAAYSCANCGRYSVVTWRTTYDPRETYRSGEPESHDSLVHWSPSPVTRPAYLDVPDHIAKAAREAWLCHAHHANVAACGVARSVIEAAAKEHGVNMQGIEAKINALKDKNLLWGDLIESAHVVRQFGNDAAHGDVIAPATDDESREVLDIMDELLHQLFTSPARSRRLTAARKDRKTSPSQAQDSAPVERST